MNARVLSAVACLWAATLAGCHGAANTILSPLERQAGIGSSTGSSNVVHEDVAVPALRSPDGAFAMRQPHDPRVRLHLGVFVKRPGGYQSQREYVTPFGLFTVRQNVRSPQSIARIAQAQSASVGQSDEQDPIADGVTTHGAHWYLIAVEDHRWDVHMQFGDSVIDAGIPENTPISTVRQLVEEVY